MLQDEMVRHGRFLFRYRSYLPLMLVPFAIWQLSTYKSYWCGSRAYDMVWDFACLALALVGSGIRFVSIGYAQSGTSGRNTSAGQVADALNTKGMYSVVRHPLYLGNLIMYTAALLYTKSPWFALAGCFALVLYYERIIATEEDYLRGKFGNRLDEWANATPCLVPKFSGWKKPGIPFSLKAGLRSEFYSVVGIVTAFYILEAIEHYFVEGKFRVDEVWNYMLVSAVVAFFVLRFLRKNTRILDSAERRIDSAP